MLIYYYDTTYVIKKSEHDSTIWLVNEEKEDIKVNAPIRCSIHNEIVVDTVTYPYLDISLLDAGISLRRRTKALKGKEEYPVHILTNNFMNYIGL